MSSHPERDDHDWGLRCESASTGENSADSNVRNTKSPAPILNDSRVVALQARDTNLRVRLFFHNPTYPVLAGTRNRGQPSSGNDRGPRLNRSMS